MKERNLIILIVGIILVGLFLITEMSNFNLNINDQSDNSQVTDYSSQNINDDNNQVNPSENSKQNPINENTNPNGQSASSNGNNT